MAQTNGSPSALEWVTVKTTLPKLPYPPMSTREPIRTERLILRPYVATDVNDFHLLRIQQEVMKWTSQGKPDTDLKQTEKVLANRLPGTDGERCYEWAICWAETGEMIGTGGSHMRTGELGWPVIGYMIRSEFWGKGIATELMSNFLKAYWALPREEVEIKVEKSTIVEGSENEVQPERITAVTLDNNAPSQNVLGKLGFKLVKKWEEEEPSTGVMELLYGYALQRPQV